MADNQRGIPFGSADEGIDFLHMAKQLAFEQALVLGVERDHPTFSPDEVYIVMFSYVLGHFKALVSTSIPDGRYYEVTYNSILKQAYVDTYRKTHNIKYDINPTKENS